MAIEQGGGSQMPDGWLWGVLASIATLLASWGLTNARRVGDRVNNMIAKDGVIAQRVLSLEARMREQETRTQVTHDAVLRLETRVDHMSKNVEAIEDKIDDARKESGEEFRALRRAIGDVANAVRNGHSKT